jgi:hypothetical protein
MTSRIVVARGKERTQTLRAVQTDHRLKCWWAGIRAGNHDLAFGLSQLHLGLDLP